MYETKQYFYGTGRRKHSVARVRVYNGTGKITINNRDIDDYFGLETLKLMVRSPLALTNTDGKFDIVINVVGGGTSGQAGAIRHGLSRALLQFDPELRSTLKEGWLPDPRSPLVGKEGGGAPKPLVAHLSSASDNLQLNNAKKPGNTPFSGLFLCPKFCLDCSVLMEFERKFMGL